VPGQDVCSLSFVDGADRDQYVLEISQSALQASGEQVFVQTPRW
jgi:hypothetical protein